MIVKEDRGLNAADSSAAGGRDGELSLAALAAVLWAHRILIAFVTALFAIASVVYALMVRPIFHSEVVVTEVREQNMGAASSLASQFGGLASIAGVNLGGAEQSHEAQAVLQSRHLVEEFIARYKLLPVVLAESKKPATMWVAAQRFRKSILNIRDDTRKGTTTISIEWTDPGVAARWANDFVALANDLIRKRAIDNAQRNIDYLNRQLATTTVVELRRVMYDLIETQTKTLMIANGRIEYAFTVVDPAVPAEQRSKPQRTLIVLFSTALGAFLGAVVALAAHSWALRRRKSALPP